MKHRLTLKSNKYEPFTDIAILEKHIWFIFWCTIRITDRDALIFRDRMIKKFDNLEVRDLR